MKRTSFAFPFAVLVLVATCFFGWLVLSSSDLLKSDQRIAAEIELERRATEEVARRAEANRPIWIGAGLIACAIVGSALATFLYDAHQDRVTHRRRLHADGNGRYPMPDVVDLLKNAPPEVFTPEFYAQTILALYNGTMRQNIEAARASQVLPHTYSPKIEVEHVPALASPAVTPALADENICTPSLPSIVDLADVLDAVKPGNIAYGKLATGELLQLPLPKVYHALYHGDTGSGKTNAIDAMLVQLHHMSARLPLKLAAGDYKRELAATWSRSPLFMGGIQTEAQGISDMLAELARQVRMRYVAFERIGNETGRVVRNYAEYAAVTGEQPDIVVCVIDELNAVLEAATNNAQLAANLKILLQIGRGAGYFVQGGFQYMTSSVFGRDGSKQFVTRAHFGAYDQTAINMLFGKVDHKALQPMIDGTTGRGLIRVVGQAQPMPFQALRCTEHDILDAIAAATTNGKTYTVPSVSTSNAQESPKTLEVGNVVVLPRSAESMPENGAEALTVEVPEVEKVQMIALAKAGISRTKICQQLYGVSAGRAYERVKQTLNAAGL